MLDKLQIIKQRFDEVSDLIIQPDIITDQKRYVQLTKEYKDLKVLVDIRDEYKELVDNLAEAEEIISAGNDPEMVEMAKMQYDEAKEKIPVMEDKIKFLLIPKDPEDSKNAVVELRAGTGGDEASIFAGDLFRMYSKYCESKGWKVELECIVYNVCHKQKLKGVYTQALQQLWYFLKLKSLMSKSIQKKYV